MAVFLPAMLNSCFYLQEWGMPQINLASNVIAALRTFETGGRSSRYLFVSSTNLASSRFGHLRAQSRGGGSDAKPLAFRFERDRRLGAELCGRVAALCSRNASAMVKQPVCAAAISSSGLVSFSLSKAGSKGIRGFGEHRRSRLKDFHYRRGRSRRHTAFALRIMLHVLAVARCTHSTAPNLESCLVGGAGGASTARAASLLEVQVDLRSDLNEARISVVKSAGDLSAVVFPHPERRADVTKQSPTSHPRQPQPNWQWQKRVCPKGNKDFGHPH